MEASGAMLLCRVTYEIFCKSGGNIHRGNKQLLFISVILYKIYSSLLGIVKILVIRGQTF